MGLENESVIIGDRVKGDVLKSVFFLRKFLGKRSNKLRWFFASVRFSFNLEGFVEDIDVIEVFLSKGEFVCISVPKLYLSATEMVGNGEWLLKHENVLVGKAYDVERVVRFLVLMVRNYCNLPVNSVREALSLFDNYPGVFIGSVGLDVKEFGCGGIGQG